jgi:hypothetical protein
MIKCHHVNESASTYSIWSMIYFIKPASTVLQLGKAVVPLQTLSALPLWILSKMPHLLTDKQIVDTMIVWMAYFNSGRTRHISIPILVQTWHQSWRAKENLCQVEQEMASVTKTQM